MKKFFLILFVFLISFNLAYSYKTYNSSYSNLSLDSNGWCANYPVTFKVYNQTQYLDKSAIKSNLCVGNDTPSKNNCQVFQSLSPSVKIYDGPFDTSKILLDEKANSSGGFKYTFLDSKPYLIELTGLSNFNDYYEPVFNVMTCKFVETLSAKKDNILFNQSYNYSGILINLSNTNINSSSNVSVKIFNNFSDINSSFLNNSIKIFEIKNSSAINFSQFKITIPLIFKNSSNLKLYKLESNSWVNLNSFKILDKTMIISSSNFGIYSVVETIPKIVEKIVINDTKLVTELNSTANVSNSTSLSPVVEKTVLKKSKSSSKLYVWYFIIGLIFAFGIFYLIQKNNKKENYHSSKSPSNDVGLNSNVEVLTTYNQNYEHTKIYVKQYKAQFSQDQIYRALKDANISKDIIDKVFSEEF